MSVSIRHGSWLQQSNLTLIEILLITYDIVCRESASNIQNEYSFGPHTAGDWGMFCRETMLVFLEGCSIKIGGPNNAKFFHTVVLLVQIDNKAHKPNL
jgi:hypothetical protein